MRFPVRRPRTITSQFSPEHPGIDIAPPGWQKGRKVFAPEESVVTEVGEGPISGRYAKLRGKNGMYYYFGHFAEVFVKVGQRIKEGAKVGRIGTTGLSTGIHTHHEIRRHPTYGQIDPLKYYALYKRSAKLKSALKDVLAKIKKLKG